MAFKLGLLLIESKLPRDRLQDTETGHGELKGEQDLR